MPDDDQTTDTSTDESTTDDTSTDDKSDALGDAGKKALDAERKRARKAEADLKKLLAENETLKAQQMSEGEKAIEEARREARTEATTAANKRVIRAEVKAAAAKKLNDPADALALLDLDTFEVDDDGNVDTEAISSAIDELVASKPYLVADAKPAPPGSGDGGARHKQPPTSIAQQIADAEAKGDVATAMSLKARQLVALNP